ncbi:hypothetical protein [Streptomyces sp. AP-93]|uniref:hypothetical protein n=1 Tax=Streptomyces sp. AP-93 TaxID=2929048 RepID=UPI001FAF9182|nr:hypothetical protein [Streptomyces sp. AP-93]MCJ0870333.1 hypothetical protein [Streptomyces sp. AP-93]
MLGTMGRMAATAVTAGAVALLGPVPQAVAATVVNCPTDNLQAAINAATPGSALRVTGTCTGNFTVDKNLALAGATGATLNGGGTGTALTVTPGVRVSLTTLTITQGAAVNGAGIFNEGTLSLNRSTVSGNTASDQGGGIHNTAGGTLTLNRSAVSGNSASYGGGIINAGAVLLNGSTVSGNTAVNGGGGIHNHVFGALTMNRSTVDGNTANQGGGINNAESGTTARLNGSTISNNTATGGTGSGGGINNAGTVTANRVTYINNNPENCAGNPVPGCP